MRVCVSGFVCFFCRPFQMSDCICESAYSIWSFAICSNTDLIKGKIRTGERVQDLIVGCISYLDTRTAFWQQQKPIYARQRDRKLMQQQWNRVLHKPPTDPTRHVLDSLEEIDTGESLTGQSSQYRFLASNLALVAYSCYTCKTIHYRSNVGELE